MNKRVANNTKELVTIEFRYHDGSSRTKKITIGIFDTLEEAIIEGNKALEVFEKHFKLNPNYNRKDRFSKNGGCFGEACRLISPLGYLQCPFDFYAKITRLDYVDVEQTITDVLGAVERYKNHPKEDDVDDDFEKD